MKSDSGLPYTTPLCFKFLLVLQQNTASWGNNIQQVFSSVLI